MTCVASEYYYYVDRADLYLFLFCLSVSAIIFLLINRRKMR